MKKKRIPKERIQNLKELLNHLGRIFEGSDRESCILGLSLLDNLLTSKLRHILVKVPKGEDQIDKLHFRDKLNLAFRLGMLETEMYEILDIAREIRNRFAHRFGVKDFGHPHLRELWKEFRKHQYTRKAIRECQRIQNKQPRSSTLNLRYSRNIFLITLRELLIDVYSMEVQPIVVRKTARSDKFESEIFEMKLRGTFQSERQRKATRKKKQH